MESDVEEDISHVDFELTSIVYLRWVINAHVSRWDFPKPEKLQQRLVNNNSLPSDYGQDAYSKTAQIVTGRLAATMA